MPTIKIIENNESERDEFKEQNDSCGSTEFTISKEDLMKLLEGKTIAMSDEEYCNFLTLKAGDE
jgi:hypothetical protein